MKLFVILFLLITCLAEAMGQVRPVKPLPDDFDERQFNEAYVTYLQKITTWKQKFKQDWSDCYEDKLVFTDFSKLKDFLALAYMAPPKLKPNQPNAADPLNTDPKCSTEDYVEVPTLRCLMRNKDHVRELKAIVDDKMFTYYLGDQEKIIDAKEAIDIADFYFKLVERHKD